MLTAIHPATGQLVRAIEPDASPVVDATLARAREALRAWRELSFDARGAHLVRVAAQLRSDADAIAPLMTEEMGKPIREARGELEKCALTAEHFAAHGAAWLADEELPSDATRSWVQHVPLGVVLGILPWNSPFWLAFRVAAPALMAGNVCVIKPDPHVPACGAALRDVFARAGVPEGVLSVVRVETDAVRALIEDPRVDAISFTGSTRAGRAVAAIAGAAIKPSVLELGGSDPAIVLEGADLAAAADALALSRTIASGQSCIAPKRLLVAAAVHDAFVERLAARLAAIRVGDPSEPETDMGPLAREDLRAELHRQVAGSLAMGARARLGGAIPEGPGWFYPVTLLTDVTPEMPVFREETFGPVAAVTRVAGEAEALALANATEYGLAASVWGPSDRALALARHIEAGQVVINGLVKTDPRLPSGGIKRSGWGRELGPDGIREFVNRQQVWLGPKA
ncbi:MAG: aldehyde dehydrogenase family protein [Sandaracinaceae bacterium]|nr:aldehyde dehydrogenase family protein [Sandaracinaceae bacterium]